MTAPLTERLRRLLSLWQRNGDVRFDPGVKDLEYRLAHLEAALEGLQDAVDRESRRQDEQIAELRHRTEARELARTLSDDARKRGI